MEPYRRLEDVPWTSWTPTMRATLLFVVDGERILLIDKKRGLGRGKVNGPGGRIEPGETPEAAAVREVEEELRVTPLSPRKLGELSFQFVDGLALFCHVFRADAFEGTPAETEEARPRWCPVDAIPFDRMWADDRHWLPHVLADERFSGRFLFDEDRMLGFAVDKL